MTIIPIRDDAHWHQLRAEHVGGSEVATLFGCCPYLTHFELWVTKSGKLPPAPLDNERMFWGRMLEAGIGEGIRQKTGWQVEKATAYYTNDNVPGMGCTPDFLCVHPTKGPGLIQTKNVDRLEYLKWVDGEPPMHNLLQVQHELACTNFAWGVLAALVGGNELKLFEYDRHAGVIAKLEGGVGKFWADVRDGIEPKAAGDDLALIAEVYGFDPSSVVDLSSDNELPGLCATAKEAGTRRRAAEKEEKQAKAAILQKIGTAARATCTGFELKRTQVFRKEHVVQASSFIKLTIKGGEEDDDTE